ncbi:MAG: nuclear transport factor 2 family protein [Thermoleophilaceae bacterium]
MNGGRSMLAIAVLLGTLAGCGAEERTEDPEAAIRGWSRAVNAGDYERAGAFFAPDAVVEQAEETRLRTPADAARFSASLPCRADVTRVVPEERASVATFRLREGRGGPCRGDAKVRFTVRDGKMTEWRQLPEAPPPRGETV